MTESVFMAITGVHGSGKSTYAKELQDRFTDLGKSVYIVDEVARSCPHRLGTIAAQEWIYTEQMNRNVSTLQEAVDVVLFDRTILDNIIYFFDILKESIGLGNEMDKWSRWSYLCVEASEWMPNYDHVIRLPLNLEWLKADDDVRPKSEEYAIRIDKLFDEFVDKYVTQHGDNIPSV